MKKGRLGKLFALGLGCSMIMSSFTNGTAVKAAEQAVESLTTVNNRCVMLQDEQASEICDFVIKNITEKYEGVYSFDNIEVEFYNEYEEEGNLVVDVEVTTDMTLIRNPQDSPYVQGMQAEIGNMADEEAKTAEAAVDAYLQNANQYYMVPVLTGFCYRVYIPNLMMADSQAAPQYSIFHRIDTEDGAILTEVQENEVFTEIKDAEDGKEYVNYVVNAELELASVNDVSYNASDAVKYATDHATDIPQYSTENGNGSDCANFVSQCVNAGGIPEDRTGGYSSGWYQDSLNWIRTGYNGKTGVVLYLQSKGYFSAASSSSSATEGSIMFWTDKSHVAMVTLIDGTTIKYSHHSSSAKPNVYYIYDSSANNVTFYVPQV